MSPEEAVINPSSLTKFRKLRLKDTDLLNLLISKTVSIAIEKDIIKSRSIIVDATHSFSRSNPPSALEVLRERAKMDEVCTALKKDPVAFRVELFNKAKASPIGRIGYDPEKYLSVVNLVAKMSNWGTTPTGVYRGFATWFSFGSYAAQVVEIKMVNNRPKVVKVFCAVNCGRVINLSGAENQVQGAVVDGISHAMFPKITFVDGAVAEKNFYSYPMLRMNDAPLDVEVKFVETEDAPTGLGEPGLPPAAPALGSAIFAATGIRLRKLPFLEALNKLK